MSSRWMLLLLVIAGMAIVACEGSADASTYQKVQPYQVEEVSGSKFGRVTLTKPAVKRLGLRTVPAGDLTVPYAALVYGNHGEEWVYTNPEPRVFIRAEVRVDRIDVAADTVYLLEGPPSGILVVTTGAAELWGTEFGVGK